MLNLVVLYPEPTDAQQFEADYAEHIKLLHEKAGIPEHVKPYSVVKFLHDAKGKRSFYQMFMLPFESAEALETAMASEGMQEVAADANRISTGGSPIVLIGQQK